MGAREHYRRGTQLYDLQRFDEAAHEYEAAYQIKEDPALLFNIGQSYRFAKKYEPAAGAFRSYLRRMTNPPNRAQVEVWLAELTKLAADEKKAAEEQARIAEEQKRAAEEQIRLRELAEAQAKLRDVTSIAHREPDLVAAARHRKMKLAGIGTAAAGGVIAIAGAGLLGGAGAIASRYNNLSTTTTTYNPSDESRFKTFRLTGAVLVGIGGVAAIAGAVVAVIASKKEKEARFAWSPSVAPGYAGFLVGGGW